MTRSEHPTTVAEIPGTWFATRHQFPLGWITIVSVNRTTRVRFNRRAKKASSLIGYVDDRGHSGWLPAGDLWRTEAAARAQCLARDLADPFDRGYVRGPESEG